MKEIIASPVTVFEEENELFETKVGEKNGKMDLLFSAWGATEKESKDRANELAVLLNFVATK